MTVITPEPPADDDLDVVEEIGREIGLTYEEAEPLRAGQKEEERDRHRWELDPASAEDWQERVHDEETAAEPLLKMHHQHRERQP